MSRISSGGGGPSAFSDKLEFSGTGTTSISVPGDGVRFVKALVTATGTGDTYDMTINGLTDSNYNYQEAGGQYVVGDTDVPRCGDAPVDGSQGFGVWLNGGDEPNYHFTNPTDIAYGNYQGTATDITSIELITQNSDTEITGVVLS